MADRIVPAPSLTPTATPVDRFVAPLRQQAGEDPMLGLARTLERFNPKLTSFLQTGHDQYKTEEEAKGKNAESYIDPSIALQKNREGWKGLIDQQRKVDKERGTNHADKLAASSPHFRRGLLKARAQRLGTGLNDHLAMIYSRNPEVTVGDSVVNLHDVDDAAILQQWAQEEVNGYAERFGLDQIDPVLVAEVFTPLAAQAADRISGHHTQVRLDRYQTEYMEEFSANTGLLMSYAGSGSSDVDDFLGRLGISENSGRWAGVNSEGFTGLYQFGPERLADFNKANGTNYKLSQFDDSPEGQRIQKQVAQWHIADIDAVIDGEGFLDKGWSRDGLRAVAHLGGIGGMKKFVLSSGGYDPKDSNGTSLSKYYRKFAGPTVALQAQREEAIANGVDPQRVNQQLVGSVVRAAIEQRNPEMLNVLDDIQAGSGPLGNVGWVKDQVRNARAEISNLAWKDEERAHEIEKREREESKRLVMTEAFGSIISDPFADVSEYVDAALASENPELAKAITTFQETALDNSYKVRTDPQIYNELRFRVGDAESDADLDRIMMDAVTAGNTRLLSPTDVGGLLDDIQRQRDNAGVLSNPLVRDYRTRLGSIVKDQRSVKGMFGQEDGGQDSAFMAVSLFDVQMRDFLAKNEGASEADIVMEADRLVTSIMGMERFARVDILAEDTPSPAPVETPAETPSIQIPPESLELLGTEAGYPLLETMAQQAGMDVETYAKEIGLFE